MATGKQKMGDFKGDGIVIFRDVAGAMKGERVLRDSGYEVKLIAPPQEMRMGCDLALAINLVEQPGIERLFGDKSVPHKQILPLTGGAPAMNDILKTTDFGRWYMVKAGNMKLSFEKATGKVVNVSGGGCPDIPYLHAEMDDKPITEAPQPRELGFTLCATMLQRAYEEALRLYQGGK
jgi:hypothetical protein